MGYREIPENRVLIFPSTAGFRGWEQFFSKESTSHTAKTNLSLLRWILETYTSEGDVVLDPMAGTGSTIVLASLLGRHGVAVEYEPRFCDMIRANIALTERQATLTPKGKMVCIQGDARELSKLLKEPDTIVTSPPYSLTREGSDRTSTGIDVQTGKSLWSKTGSEFSEGNIQKLPHGDIDAVITSPPYESSVPAYDEKWLEEHWDDERNSPKHKTMRFGRSMKGYPNKADSIVTSPPYESTQPIQDFEAIKTANLRRGRKLSDIESWSMRDEGYGENPSNIGNLKSETYLEAMIQVYRECWKVLKQSGKLILVTKNFIRDKQVVRLDLDTIKLCEATGFRLLDRWYFKLPTRSFWRILYAKRFPHVPEVEHEDILVLDKGVDIPRVKVK